MSVATVCRVPKRPAGPSLVCPQRRPTRQSFAATTGDAARCVVWSHLRFEQCRRGGAELIDLRRPTASPLESSLAAGAEPDPASVSVWPNERPRLATVSRVQRARFQWCLPSRHRSVCLRLVPLAPSRLPAAEARAALPRRPVPCGARFRGAPPLSRTQVPPCGAASSTTFRPRKPIDDHNRCRVN